MVEYIAPAPVRKLGPPLPDESAPSTSVPTPPVDAALPVSGATPVDDEPPVSKSRPPLTAEPGPPTFETESVVDAPPVDVQPACEVEYTTPAPAVTRMAPAPVADYVDPAAVDPRDHLWRRFWALDLEQQLELESRFLALPPEERGRVHKLIKLSARCPR